MKNIAHIITIGDEILIGQIVDTNSAHIASELTLTGFKIDQIISISDKKEAIVEQIKRSMQMANLVIITGGLGPTNDDITKKTLCELFNSELIPSAEVLSDVEAFLSQRGVKMNALNHNQALVPKCAKVLRNRQGTAPGMWFNYPSGVIISLPGVPFEMKGLMKQEVLPKIQQHFSLPGIYYKTLKTTGIAESNLAELIADWEDNLPQNVSLAYLPSPGLVKLRLGTTGHDKVQIKALIDSLCEELKARVGNKYFGENDDTLESVIGKMLRLQNKTISTAESCTGGSVGVAITSVPGSSAWFKGSIVAYSNSVKTKLLSVSQDVLMQYGAVSEQVVTKMALGACKILGTDYSIATSGIAGPDGGTDDKPVGTVWIAIAHPKGCLTRKFQFGNERDINVKRTTMAALNMLRMVLSE